MNIDLLEKNIREKIKSLYFAKFPEKGVQIDVPNFDEDMLRLRKIKGRINDHRNWLNAKQKQADLHASCVKQLKYVRRIIDEGRCVMAIDVERTVTGQILQEVGISYFKDGAITSMNLRVANTPKRRIGFSFGATEVMEFNDLKNRVLKETAKAGHYVGHSLSIDFDILKKNDIFIPKCNFTDTMWISAIVPEVRDASLSKLAAYFGVDASHPHNGGNDARYNLELLLAMVEAYGTYE